MTKKEFLVQDDSPVLKEFIKVNSEQLDSLIKDSKTAQVGMHFIKLYTTPYSMLLDIYLMLLSDSVSLQESYGSVVEYFGENPKTTQPSMFFPLFSRFVKAYKVRMCGRILLFIHYSCCISF